jgi:hypothetical protein
MRPTACVWDQEKVAEGQGWAPENVGAERERGNGLGDEFRWQWMGRMDGDRVGVDVAALLIGAFARKKAKKKKNSKLLPFDNPRAWGVRESKLPSRT